MISDGGVQVIKPRELLLVPENMAGFKTHSTEEFKLRRAPGQAEIPGQPALHRVQLYHLASQLYVEIPGVSWLETTTIQDH